MADKNAKTNVTPEKTTAPAKKTAAKKDFTTAVYVQYLGKDVAVKDTISDIKKIWRKAGNKVGDIKDMKLYVKPEDNRIYFVINGDFDGFVEI